MPNTFPVLSTMLLTQQSFLGGFRLPRNTVYEAPFTDYVPVLTHPRIVAGVHYY